VRHHLMLRGQGSYQLRLLPAVRVSQRLPRGMRR
jgi:hypothetical protein